MIGPHGENLVFVLGVPRSGTTLLCALLANHPDVVSPPEPWLMLALESVGHTGTSHPADARLLATGISELLDEDDRLAAARAYARTTYDRILTRGHGRVLLDKTPRYYHILPFLEKLFPAARALWLRRNPFDVAASYKATWGVDIAKLLRDHIGDPAALDLVVGLPSLRAYAAARPRCVYPLGYEQLVEDPQATLEPVLRFLELAPREELTHLEANLDTLRSSTMGDRKILETRTVHGGSVGTGLRELPLESLQMLHDALGHELVQEIAGDAFCAQLREAGVVDRGPDTTREVRERAEAALAQRWTETSCPADVATREEVQRIAAAEIEAREIELDELRATHAERDASLDLARATVRSHQAWAQLTPARRIARASTQLARALLDLALLRRPMRPTPSLSIIIPIIDARTDLRSTVDSIVQQGYPEIEHIVVAAGREARATAIRNRADGLRLVTVEPDANRIEAINAGLATASGDIIAWIDPGLTFEPGSLRRVGEQFVAHPSWQAAYFQGVLCHNGWLSPEPDRPSSDLFTALGGESVPPGGVFICREPFHSIRELDPERPLVAEVKLWLALTRWFRLGRGNGQVITRRVDAEVAPTPELARACDAVRREFRDTMRFIGYARRVPRHLGLRLSDAVRPHLHRRRWHYPLALRRPLQPPPCATAEGLGTEEPVCPLSGRPFERLLLTVVDTREGTPRLARVHLRTSSGVARLWCGSDDPAPVAPPLATDGESPFRGYRGQSRLARSLERVLREGAASQSPRPNAIEHVVRAACTMAPARRVLAVGDVPGLGETNAEIVTLERAEVAPLRVPIGESFDMAIVGPAADLRLDPFDAVRRLQMVIAPGGRIVITVPNLDSGQLELFGPTWSPWHLGPGSAFVREAALRELARQCALGLRSICTWSDVLTTARSLRLRETGLAEPLLPSWAPPSKRREQAQHLVAFAAGRLDPRGRGDFITATFVNPGRSIS
jgi:glycosyltransferase involved in cell wall biosynthesis